MEFAVPCCFFSLTPHTLKHTPPLFQDTHGHLPPYQISGPHSSLLLLLQVNVHGFTWFVKASLYSIKQMLHLSPEWVRLNKSEVDIETLQCHVELYRNSTASPTIIHSQLEPLSYNPHLPSVIQMLRAVIVGIDSILDGQQFNASCQMLHYPWAELTCQNKKAQ